MFFAISEYGHFQNRPTRFWNSDYAPHTSNNEQGDSGIDAQFDNGQTLF